MYNALFTYNASNLPGIFVFFIQSSYAQCRKKQQNHLRAHIACVGSYRVSYEKCLVSSSSLHPMGKFALRRAVTFEQSEFKLRTKGIYLTWGAPKGGGIFNRTFVNISLAEFWTIGNGNYFLCCENLCSIKMYFIYKNDCPRNSKDAVNLL